MTMNFIRRIVFASLILALPVTPLLAEELPRVRLTTTLGDIVVQLDPTKAPLTVENFLSYVRDGAYDGTIFHRVIDGFMIQAGGFREDFSKIPTYPPIQNEANNGMGNLTGTIAMARTGDPHSATSQFFISVADNSFLNHRSETPRGWGYTVFGKVVEGMYVVEQIQHVATGEREVQIAPDLPPVRFKDVPQTPVVIQEAVVDTINLSPTTPPATPGFTRP